MIVVIQRTQDGACCSKAPKITRGLSCYCSGLPPASTLFTDSEASSEAEEDRSAVPGKQSQRAALSHQEDQHPVLPVSKRPLLQNQQQQQHKLDFADKQTVTLAACPAVQVCHIQQ